MATLLVVAASTEDLFLGDFYTYAKGGGRVLQINRPAAELPRLRALKKAMHANQVAVGVTLTAQELSTFPPDADLFAEEI
jgi:hypothetical protein